MSEPLPKDAQPVDVRVGSATNALRPISRAERSLAAGPAQWVALLAVAGAAFIADQLTKQVVATDARGRRERRPRRPVLASTTSRTPGSRSGSSRAATTIVIAITAVAVGWMLWFFARSGRRHPVLPVALGLVLGGSIANLVDRVRLGHVTDFLDLDALARVQPRRHVHRRRRRRPLRRARARRPAAPDARSTAMATLRFTRR